MMPEFVPRVNSLSNEISWTNKVKGSEFEASLYVILEDSYFLQTESTHHSEVPWEGKELRVVD